MKKYLRIKSAGLIDPMAFSLIGASTKRGDESKIGYFGSGLKYAIASLLRNNIGFRVFAGKKELVFTTKQADFREQEFQVICVNGKETSLTTQMGGKDWDNSFAPIREIYSNALDEDQNASISECDIMATKEGFTCFFIQMNENVYHFFQHRGEYFCNQVEPLSTGYHANILPGSPDGVRLFRKGILCFFDHRKKSLFYYDSNNFGINESRVLSSEWDGRYNIVKAWAQCKDASLIEKLIAGLSGANTGFYEHDLDWGYAIFSEAWKDACKDKKFLSIEHSDMFNDEEKKGAMAMPFALLKQLKGTYKEVYIVGMSGDNETIYTEVNHPDVVIKEKAEEAMAILKATNYLNRLDPKTEVEFVNFGDSHTLAQAKNGKILLSVKLDTKTPEEIAKIIIEENEHNITGFNDKSREFQDHLFDLYYEQLTLNNKLKAKIASILGEFASV